MTTHTEEFAYTAKDIEEIEDTPIIENHTISEVKILRSNAGYYIGTEYYDEEFQCWFPNDRQSGYFKTTELAQKELDFHNFCEHTSE